MAPEQATVPAEGATDAVGKSSSQTNSGGGHRKSKGGKHHLENTGLGTSPKQSGQKGGGSSKGENVFQRLFEMEYGSLIWPLGGSTNLSHVPCRFFKNGACTAGANCPFSHNTEPDNYICKYFLKGNCKFGNKCALLHSLPGQPAPAKKGQSGKSNAASANHSNASSSFANPSSNNAHQATSSRPLPFSSSSRSFAQRSNSSSFSTHTPGNVMNINGEDVRVASPLSPTFMESVQGPSSGSPASIKSGQLPSQLAMARSPSSHATSRNSMLGLRQDLDYFDQNVGSAPTSSLASALSSEDRVMDRYLQGRSNPHTPLSSLPSHTSPALYNHQSQNSTKPLPIRPPSMPDVNRDGISHSPFHNPSSKGLYMPMNSYGSDAGSFTGGSPMDRLNHRWSLTLESSNGEVKDILDISIDSGPEDDYDAAPLPSSLNDLLTPNELERRRQAALAEPSFSPLKSGSFSSLKASSSLSNMVARDANRESQLTQMLSELTTDDMDDLVSSGSLPHWDPFGNTASPAKQTAAFSLPSRFLIPSSNGTFSKSQPSSELPNDTSSVLHHRVQIQRPQQSSRPREGSSDEDFQFFMEEDNMR
ncbi:hypothetical protein BZG36_02282 [Bifiguratus adelaidae]|uniref:mRNA 3'-end-processing protein n=1 Tax=Bifiguratus adelaidae TaxID=1938954 RepID=A0A261XY71_9FUNG|nr:hypothetical protein BZG36_02282 [Bifiguratus adelaidae]